MATVKTKLGFEVNADERYPLSYCREVFQSVFYKGTVGTLTNIDRFHAVGLIKKLIKSELIPQSGALEGWLIKQVEQNAVDPSMIELICNTLRCISTGYRNVPLSHYRVTLAVGDDQTNKSGADQYLFSDKGSLGPVLREKRKKLIHDIRHNNHENGLLYQWVCTDRGLNDCLNFFLLVLEP